MFLQMMLFSGCTQVGTAAHTVGQGVALPGVGRELYEMLRHLDLTTQFCKYIICGTAAAAGIPACSFVMR